MDVSSGKYGALAPFEYHASVASYLHDNEREVWDWAAERTSRADQLDSLRAALLRDTYRLDPQSHADVHTVLNTAMERLGIQVPATLYQSPGEQMNASLYFVPGEVHIIVQGPLLERMAQEELLAIFGHELAHYVLWSSDGGRFLIAERILANALAAPGINPSLRETYRRYSLYTELYADRGGALPAARSVLPFLLWSR
jgi:Zn-dependent protease with chaperone function